MAGKKTIIIKKPASAKKKKTPISVYVEKNQDLKEEPSTKPIVPKKKPVAPPPPEVPKDKGFKFYCVRCGQKLEAKVEWCGMEAPCTSCGSMIEIPEPPDALPPQEDE